MSEAKHTPGPWVVDIENTGVEIFDSQGMPVMTMDRGIAQLHANARLIVAAPDHHAVALELYRLMLVIESAVRWQDPSHSEAVVAMLEANRAAIAKATGETK